MELKVDCPAQHLPRFGFIANSNAELNCDFRAQHSTNSGQKFGDSRNSNVELNEDVLLDIEC